MNPSGAASGAIRRTQAAKLAAIAGDARLLLLAAVAAVSVFDPALALRGGAYIVSLLAIPNLRKFRPAAPDQWAVGLAVFTLISLAWSVAPHLTDGVWKDQAAVAVLFIGLRVVVTDKRSLGFVGLGYVAGCIYSVTLLVLNGAASPLSLTYSETAGRNGLDGLNYNYTAYALASGVAVAVLLGLITPRWLPILLFTGLALWVGVLQTGTRGGIIAVILVAIWLLVPGKYKPLSLRFVYVSVVAIALGIFTGWFDGLITGHLQPTAGRDAGDLSRRLTIWPEARAVFEHHPWLGTGAGTFPTLNSLGVYAHNALLDIASGIGLAGLLVFLSLIVTTLITHTKSLESRPRAILVGTILLATAPPMLSGYWHQSPAAWIVLALFSRMTVLRLRGQADDVTTSATPKTAHRT